ncbi:hypothetical protein J3R83DRAFT_4261, partial [Lanmaoa asiatica]
TASADEVNLNAPHAPLENAIEAFNHVLHKIKHEIVQSRHHWDKHEPRMWSRATGLSDAELTRFSIEEDLVRVRSGFVSYGTVILGKIRIPAVDDELGQGYIHVRYGEEDVTFHSILHVEGKRDADGHPHLWRAIQTDDYPLKFFND